MADAILWRFDIRSVRNSIKGCDAFCLDLLSAPVFLVLGSNLFARSDGMEPVSYTHLATMYVYKPMAGHNLMQAIARVNRVFKDKEGGLVVDLSLIHI